MLNVIQNLFPSLSTTDYNKVMSFIDKKCSEYFFSAYLKLTNENVDDAIEFFKFDEKLRALLLRYILRFENQIKTDFALEIEKNSGSDSFWNNPSFYLKSARSPKPSGLPSDFNYVTGKIRNWIRTSNLSNYSGCSNYLALHACSFGSFVDLVKFIDIPLKNNFVNKYVSILPSSAQTLSFLTSYLSCIKKVRDKCAHGSYTITLSMERALNSSWSRLLLPVNSPDSNRTFTSFELAIYYLLQYSNCRAEFKKRLKNLLVNNASLLTKYNGRHSLSATPITNLF